MHVSDPIRLLLRVARFLPLLFFLPLGNWIASRPIVQPWFMREFDRMAQTMLKGIPIWSAADERPLKIAYLTHAPSRAQVLVLGSSRAMEISSAWFPHQTMFNAAVPAGGIDDAVSIFELCLGTGKTPDLVLLELSPMLIPVHIGYKDWRSVAPYFDRALARYHISKPPSRLISELLSTAQLHRNLRALAGIPWGTFVEDAQSAILPDGFHRYSRTQEDEPSSKLDEEVALTLLKHPQENVNSGRTHSVPHEFEIALFRRFLDDLFARRVRLVVLLPPVHPLAYEYYAKQGGYDEHWIRKEMASRGIPVVGSFSPAIARATSSDFYDEAHPRPGIVRRLLADAHVIEE